MNARFRYETVPLPREDALAKRMEDLKWIDAQIEELRREKIELESQPLPTDYQKQIVVNPGEEGYDTAPYSFVTDFHPDVYQIQLK